MISFKKNTIKGLLIGIIIMFIILVGFDVYLLLHIKENKTAQNHYVVDNPDQKIKEIENYLDSISSSYISDVQILAKQRNLPSWGCGPSSYALAKIIDQKFFNNQLIINASYNNKEPNEIIERFGLVVSDKKNLDDHAWLEIYLQDKFLYIDPTIGQFGKINKIAYQVFSIGDTNLQKTLKTNYGIEDVRISLLVPKVINRIPVSQEPYPGITIKPDAISYYLEALEYRNSVNDGIEPIDWKPWVSFLMDKYL